MNMDVVSFSAGRYPVYLATFVEEAIFSPLYIFWCLCQKLGGHTSTDL
jgi:hypothetical protein